jgi:Flp pilus assembly protein TadG
VRRRSCRSDDRGSIAVETAILTPALVAAMGLIVVVGRLGNSKLDLDAAAQSAARTISIARSPDDARAAAEDQARASLRVGSPTCRDWTFDVTETPTEITVDITCTVDVSAASLVPVPGSLTQTASASEVLDRYREKDDEFRLSEGSDRASSGLEDA